MEQALSACPSRVDKCGARYHVLNNASDNDDIIQPLLNDKDLSCHYLVMAKCDFPLIEVSTPAGQLANAMKYTA